MKTSHSKGSKSLILTLSILIFSCTHCCADSNAERGLEFSDPNNTTLSDKFKSNLNNLLDSLATNVLSNGFYKTTFGKNSDKIYGLVQCRADVSPNNCTNCINQSIKTALQSCPNSNSVAVWFTWCFLHYSNESFFGVWDQSIMATYNDTDFEDPAVVPEGVAFMGRLASEAPNQLRMFEMSVLDVGQYGKRYGMVQCRMDMSKSDCGKCLDAQLASGSMYYDENKRGWEIYGISCRMWYDDFQFFSNISTTTNAGGGKLWHGGMVVSMTALPLMLIFLMIF